MYNADTGEQTRSRWHSSPMANKTLELELERPQAAGANASSSKRSFGKPGAYICGAIHIELP